MKYTRYTTRSVRDIEPNACCSGICGREQRKGCEQTKTCLYRLCGHDEAQIAKVSSYDCKDHSLKIQRAVDRWRKEEFKKCRAVSYEIKEEL